MYFSGQGKVFIAAILAGGVLGPYRWVDNVPSFKLSPATTKKEHKESWSGQRLLDKVLTTENKVSFQAEMESWSKENLALAVRGESVPIAGATVSTGTPYVLPDGLAVGDVVPLPHQNITGSILVKDSTSVTPLPVDAAHVKIDPIFGTATILDLGAFVQPFKVSYVYGATTSVPFFSQPTLEVAVRFEGINTADNNRNVLVELYRVALDPTKELGLISDDFEKFTIVGDALIDANRPDDPVFGRFGRLVYIN